ncbi:MAG: hypothetical protein GFH27_549301n197 [Chloroflexi bacterium AL-W]|nr:hypothetical protein [Chloroflexi bacterium AL-N1]NOK68390.1 hypothetical protein [Chloroflexi bacterium AL-N10]NOK74036.1 hypothetical protein [Chloroflexi bacterium AL-N5]NOK83004.1 hypothetical protein [Chloroflexi bacterium AL-W]NOK90526.1 hypothetical protein [Chloroflexi bacterium AL-N15]
MSTRQIKLWEHIGIGLIISWPSGIIYTNQTGGTTCLAPQLEGIFVPLRNECTEKELTLISPENDLWDYFTNGNWAGTGATSGLDIEDADFIDALLTRIRLFPDICVDRGRLTESHEAWVFVSITGDEPRNPPIFSGFEPYPRPGVLTWQHSD